MDIKENPAALACAPGQMHLQLAEWKSTTAPARPTKWRRVLKAFFDGKSLNMFEGERLGEHALHSTASRLQSMGVIIHRREESVPGFGGAPTRVMRYWLAPESRQRAAELLGMSVVNG